MTFLNLLDLYAAFFTVDHDILIEYYAFAFRNDVLLWLTTIITRRMQRVHVGGQYSTYSAVHYGMPQGSALGLILFLLYTACWCPRHCHTLRCTWSLIRWWHPAISTYNRWQLRSHIPTTGLMHRRHRTLNVLKHKFHHWTHAGGPCRRPVLDVLCSPLWSAAGEQQDITGRYFHMQVCMYLCVVWVVCVCCVCMYVSMYISLLPW